MSSLIAMVVLLLLLLPAVVVAAVAPAPATASGSTEVAAGERRPPSLVPFRPRQQHGHGSGGRQPSFHGRAAGGCMPRGFRVPPSAPSRYVNYHTLDAGVCGAHDGRRAGRKQP